MLKYKLISLRNNIIENIDFISKEYPIIYDISDELNRIIGLNMSHSLMFQWWVENEDKVIKINQILETKNN